MVFEIALITLILSLTLAGSVAAKVLKIKSELDFERVKVLAIHKKIDLELDRLNQSRTNQNIVSINKKSTSKQNQKTC
jgi:hypothetical protein